MMVRAPVPWRRAWARSKPAETPVMTSDRVPGERSRAGINLSEWALDHRPLVAFLVIVAALMGALAYT